MTSLKDTNELNEKTIKKYLVDIRYQILDTKNYILKRRIQRNIISENHRIVIPFIITLIVISHILRHSPALCNLSLVPICEQLQYLQLSNTKTQESSNPFEFSFWTVWFSLLRLIFNMHVTNLSHGWS